MSFDPWERVRLGRTRVEVTRPGLGSAEIGGLSTAVPEAQAQALLWHGWGRGYATWARHLVPREGGSAG